MHQLLLNYDMQAITTPGFTSLLTAASIQLIGSANYACDPRPKLLLLLKANEASNLSDALGTDPHP